MFIHCNRHNCKGLIFKPKINGNQIQILFFLNFFLLMWTIFQAFVQFVTVSSLIYVLLFWLRGMWNPAPPPRIEPQLPALEGEVLPTGLPGKALNIDILMNSVLVISFAPLTDVRTPDEEVVWYCGLSSQPDLRSMNSNLVLGASWFKVKTAFQVVDNP